MSRSDGVRRRGSNEGSNLRAEATCGPNPPYFARLDPKTNGSIDTFDAVPFIRLLNKACLP